MNITNGADIKKNSTANIIIYALAGNGKTTVAGLLPGRTLVLDIDGTTQVLEGYENVDIAKIDGKDVHASLGQFYQYAKSNLDKYDNIFIDNITHYQKLWLLNKADKTKSGMPELKDYALLDNHLLRVIEMFNALPTNTIYTFWETKQDIISEDGTKYSLIAPDVRDKIVNHLMGTVNIVARLMRNAEGERMFLFEGTQSIMAKNHLDSRKFAKQEELLNFEVNK